MGRRRRRYLFRFGTFDELQARLAGLVEARKLPADPGTSGGADG
jgi:hypothetical protein